MLTRVCCPRFLLKYTSRDTVTILNRGSGGVVEVRQAINAYEEKSPLYGLVQFRRKKFILKYVPEGTSRILQGNRAPQDCSPCRANLVPSPLDGAIPIDIGCLFSLRHHLLLHRIERIERGSTRDISHAGNEGWLNDFVLIILASQEAGRYH